MDGFSFFLKKWVWKAVEKGILSLRIGGKRPTMHEQDDQFILDAYKKAVDLNLEPDFIRLLEEELKRRNVPIHKKTVY